MPERRAARPAVELLVGDWAAVGARLRPIREQVFVIEQGVPAALEWDGADPGAVHVLALTKREPVGTGRLLPTGKIGRLAVLAAFRGHGVGSLVLRRLVELARRRGLSGVYLHAQVEAVGFYAAHGFVAEGPEFDEAGLRHRRMRLAFSAEQRADPAADGAAHDPVDG
ncbi:MAG TPA: GNAT family N-acetyltransferase [Steroidobacteraceae bacterium]|nr:GNAT family N-acetyltransferase [Steroidobacteraceae bacterium]